jgi:DNA-binding transcriptional regulator YiaG
VPDEHPLPGPDRASVQRSPPITPAELRAAREFLGLTHEDLARHVGRHPRTVRAWEHGEKAINPLVLAVLDELRERADAEVRHMVRAADPRRPVMYADPRSMWSRRICYRAAQQIGPAARITYPEP